MGAAPMQYFEPNFLNEALVVLDRFGPRAKALAGGTRLGPALRDDRGDVIALVNLKRIASLAVMAVSDDRVTIGALVTAAELARSPAIAASAPLLAAAAASMGSRQLRALASIGGNVCSGDPASDLTVALLASDAACVLGSLDRGERRLPLCDLLTPGALNCASGELLIAVEVPVSGARSAYRKMMDASARPASHLRAQDPLVCGRHGQNNSRLVHRPPVPCERGPSRSGSRRRLTTPPRQAMSARARTIAGNLSRC
jgi:CO/xanthine dehydrogenase FAD-binding subunit